MVLHEALLIIRNSFPIKCIFLCTWYWLYSSWIIELSLDLCSDYPFCSLWAKRTFQCFDQWYFTKIPCFALCVSAQRCSADRSERPHRHSAADPQSTDHPHGAGHGNASLCVSVFCSDNHAGWPFWLKRWTDMTSRLKYSGQRVWVGVSLTLTLDLCFTQSFQFVCFYRIIFVRCQSYRSPA